MRQLLHLIRNIFRRSNIGTLIFLLLNLMLMSGFVLMMEGGGNEVQIVLTVLAVNIISLIIAFSPVGQAILCAMTGARKMSRRDFRNRILPLAQEVLEKAKNKTPALPGRIKIRYMRDPNPNAFAIGSNTICVTEGLLELPDHQIQGILAHEVGHLALQHTVVQILIGGANPIMAGFIVFGEILAVCGAGITIEEGRKQRNMSGCLAAIIMLFFVGMVVSWTKLCLLLLRGSSRANEYEADKYAYELGYGEELAEVLDDISLGEPQSSFLKSLTSTHPDTDDRIGRLQSYGVTYGRM